MFSTGTGHSDYLAKNVPDHILSAWRCSEGSNVSVIYIRALFQFCHVHHSNRERIAFLRLAALCIQLSQLFLYLKVAHKTEMVRYILATARVS
jgi:hypothetical protein